VTILLNLNGWEIQTTEAVKRNHAASIWSDTWSHIFSIHLGNHWVKAKHLVFSQDGRARISQEFTRINIDSRKNQLVFMLDSRFKNSCNYIYKCNYNYFLWCLPEWVDHDMFHVNNKLIIMDSYVSHLFSRIYKPIKLHSFFPNF